MCVLMFGVLLYLARALLLPLLCAFAVGLTFGPLIGLCRKAAAFRPGSWRSSVVLLLIGAANVAVVMLAGPASPMIAQAPEIGAAFADKLHIFDRPLAALNELQAALGIDRRTKSVEPQPGAHHRRHRDHRHAGRGAIRAGGRCCSSPRCSSSSWAGPRFRKHAVNWFATRDARLRALKILNDIEEQPRRLLDRGDRDQPWRSAW